MCLGIKLSILLALKIKIKTKSHKNILLYPDLAAAVNVSRHTLKSQSYKHFHDFVVCKLHRIVGTTYFHFLACPKYLILTGILFIGDASNLTFFWSPYKISTDGENTNRNGHSTFDVWFSNTNNKMATQKQYSTFKENFKE